MNDSIDQSIQQKLDILKEQFRQQLENKLAKLVQIWDLAVNQHVDSSLGALYQLLHQLAGSAKTFGYPEISLLAKELEDKLKSYLADHLSDHSDAELRELDAISSKLVKVIRAALENKARPMVDSEVLKITEHHRNRAVYIVEDDVGMADWLHLVLERNAYYPTVFYSLADLKKGLQIGEPALILLDIALPEGQNAGLDFCQAHYEASNPIPIIILSQRQDFATRLQALRSGAKYFLGKPFSQTSLISSMRDVVDNLPLEPYRILLIKDDKDMLDVVTQGMEHPNIRVKAISDPTEVLQNIERFKPELIIIGMNMPGCHGLEVGQVIRQQIKHANIPLLFMSSGDAPAEIVDEIKLSGDDFMIKPGETWKIRDGLLARLKRARLVNQYLNELLGQMSFKDQHDDLTGLPNRKQLEHRLDIAIRNVQEGIREHVALMLVDLDNFQHVNDAYGHVKGDNLLIDVARRLESALPTSAIISRPGGDEFAILYKAYNDAEHIVQEARRLLKLCELPFLVGQDEVRLNFSIGIALYQHGMGSLAGRALFKQADTALFRAKSSGKNAFVVFEQEMESELVAQVSMTSDLRKALLKDEFHLMFQPQVSLVNDGLFGAEVLIRWQHPERGLVSPGVFIPVAENHGLIDQVGEYVMRSSVRQIATWRQTYGRTVPLAVNVSPRQFARSDFVEQVASLLAEYHVEGRWLELEITESALAQDIDTAVDKLIRLKKIGVRMAVDDFGTGFSNLASLKRYPVDVLKIDRSFIRDLPNDGDNLAIVAAIVQMAKTLGLKLLAEGVENEQQMQIMRNQECDLIQGFYIARPMDLASFEKQYLVPMAKSKK